MGKVSQIPVLERPYEKLKFLGSESLSDSELLSIIINTGTKENSALEISQELIKNYNGLRFLIDSSIEQLMKLKGIGENKAIRMKAVAEIVSRINKPSINKLKINNREDVVKLAEDLKFKKVEVIKLILLNNQNLLIKEKNIAVGSESNVSANIKTILNEAISSFAPKMIVVHNHPSGNCMPSFQDIEFTRRLKETTKLIDIELIDHIVISENGFSSI